MTWQPVETATRDEKEVLLGHPDGSYAVARWYPPSREWTDGIDVIGWATHWMPLPDPPVNEEAKP